MKFVHLHVHSHYSLLDGLGTPAAIISRAKEMGMNSIALTDHGAMYGAIEFYKAARKEGIKPIIGVETYVAPRTLKDKAARIDTNPYHLILLAKNIEGYRNLMKLVSIAHVEGYYYKPRIDKEILRKYSGGLIASSACLIGEIPRLVVSGEMKTAEKAVNEYQKIFGKENFYLELQLHPEIREQEIVNQGLKKLSKKTSAPLVITCDSHYVRKQDANAHDVLICVQTGKTVDDPKRMKYDGNYSLRDPKDILEHFKDVPEAIENTVKIARECNLEIPFEENLLPEFEVPGNKKYSEYLREVCKKNILRRYPQAAKDKQLKTRINERLDWELETIDKMGLESYFLIVSDFVKWAKQQGIMVGPGRGSAAGSIVSYLMEITDLEPLQFNLLFERFLNPDRHEMPDIDMDFADHRRAEVINYVAQKYGEDHVSGIITFGTMAARAAVRDVGRALGMAYAEVDKIAKVIPPPVQGRHIPLSKSVADAPELREFYVRDPKAKRLLDIAIILEGTVRHAGQHASAFVISKDALEHYVPVQISGKGDIKLVTQYSMYPVAELGLLKMDFLGLANLTIIERALEIIEAVHGDKIDIGSLPLDDKETYKLLGEAETTGVFQLESAGMKRYLKQLEPTVLDDIVAMVALYRPGPIQFIDSFIRRKHGQEEIVYPHPKVENALKSTYGIPVYQEQVMQISRDLARFTGGEADTLRKAMGKKIVKLMAEMEIKFMAGCVANGISRQKAEEVFAMMKTFEAYGFNKSHAACYGLIAYQTAYLKAHYPECFMAALMTSDFGDTDRIAIEIEEVERMGLKVLPPDVNESFVDFGVVKETKNIRFGLSAIKNLGMMPAKVIVKERKKNGPYKSFEDFIDRLIKTDVLAELEKDEGKDPSPSRTILNKKSIEALAKSGALDDLGERAQIIGGMEIITKRISDTLKVAKSTQAGLFGEVLASDIDLEKLDLPMVEPAGKKDKLAWEKELLGVYLSEHPLKEYGEIIAKISTHQLDEITKDSENHKVKISGIITSIKKINTRSGQPMLFVGIEDLTGKIELLVFPKVLERHPEVFQADQFVIVSGRVSTKDDQPNILVESAKRFDPDDIKDDLIAPEEFEEITRHNGKINPKTGMNKAPAIEEIILDDLEDASNEFVIDLPKSTRKSSLEKLKKLLQTFPGNCPVVLRIEKNGKIHLVKTKSFCDDCAELKTKVKKLLP